MLRTTNGGTTWNFQNCGTSQNLLCITFIDANTGYASGNNGTIIRTTNGGLNWSPQTTNTTNSIYSVSFIDANTGSAAAGNLNTPLLLHTTNGGNLWASQPTPAVNDLFAVDLYGPSLVLVGGLKTLLISSNGGSNWINQSQVIDSSTCHSVFIVNPNSMWAVGNLGKILRSTDSGANWVNTYNNLNQTFHGIQFLNENTGYVTGTQGLILKTTDAGSNWNTQNSSTEEFVYKVSFLDGNTGYAVSEFGILKTTNGGEPIGIKPISTEVPRTFELYQNYPNPFNPVTKISFQIPAPLFPPEGGKNITPSPSERVGVRLVIYDLPGHELQTLVNENLNPGIYSVTFDASQYASGVYFYKLTADNPSSSSGQVYSDVRKMVLIK
jgi:photosystem II stability/assembly factor-like uncharacterized protein